MFYCTPNKGDDKEYKLEEYEEGIVLPVDLFHPLQVVGRHRAADGNAWDRFATQVRYHIVDVRDSLHPLSHRARSLAPSHRVLGDPTATEEVIFT